MRRYRGKVAFVDLSANRIVEEELPEKIYRSFLGGAGLGAKILYERMKPGVDPLGPDNVLGFAPGLLSGTSVPMATKYTVLAKSPLTDTWGESNSGGLFPAAMKAAGYDAIFFTGMASQPVYLYAECSKIEIRDANHLWGKDTVETVECLTRDSGNEKIRVVCIGPCGENSSLISCIVTDNGRVAGRSGLGAVMGSKKLKAIVVQGSKTIEPVDRKTYEKFQKATINHLRAFDDLPFLSAINKTGTCGGISELVKMGVAPIKNWRFSGKEAFPEYEKIGGNNFAKYQLRKAGCGKCHVNCGGIVRVNKGSFVVEGRKPEYETVVAFGTMLANSNAESIIKANEICDRFGLDTISTGAVIAFAMECYEKGIIGKKETEGIELKWGNASAMIAMLNKIVKREGLGGILADGTKRACEQIGRETEEWAIHVHGQEPGYHDPRLYDFRGLGYITGAAPGRHMISGTSIRLEQEGKLGPYPELQKPSSKDEYENRGKIHALGVSYNQAFSDTGMCLFALFSGSNIPLVDVISGFTGWDFTADEMLNVGKRTVTLRQAFNIREGKRAEDFSLPERIARPPESGPLKDRKIDFNAIRKSFFKAMDWELETGIPSPKCLSELGLESLVDCFQIDA
jgi:aldehyde:ferredoxin oxidoreductase